MSTGTIEYARAEAVVDHAIERVWAVVGTFGGIEAWIDGVTACTVEREGIGAIRTVTRNGVTVREQLVRRDVSVREISYAILPPHPLPAADVSGTIMLEPLGGRTRISWCSHASHFELPAETLGEGISAFYAASIDGLARLLDARHGVGRG